MRWCEPVGLLIQLGIREAGLAARDGGLLRTAGRLRFEHLHDGGVGDVDRCRVPGLHHGVPLLGAQHLDAAHRPLAVGGDCVQHAQVVLRHPLDAPPVEQIEVVDPCHADDPGPLPDVHFQVEADRLCPVAHEPLRFDWRRPRIRSGLHRKQHLEDRRGVEPAWRREHLDQTLERQILMLVRFERRLPYLRQQIAEALVCRHAQPQHDRAGKESDQLLQVRVLPVRDRAPHHHIVATGVARQEHAEDGEQPHVERRVVLLAQLLHSRGPLAGQDRAMDFARKRLDGRPRPIRRQLEDRGNAGQLPRPVRDQRGQRRVRQPALLPDRVVRVLDRQWGQWIVAAPVAVVQRVEFLSEHGIRPLVAGDVMNGPHEDVRVVGNRQQLRPDHRPVRQVEGQRFFLPQLLLDPPRPIGLVHSTQICRRHIDAHVVLDHLPWLSVDFDEARTQHLMPRNNRLNGMPDRVVVERAVQPQDLGDVVLRAVAFQAIDEPQPLLAVGRRHTRRARRLCDL